MRRILVVSLSLVLVACAGAPELPPSSSLVHVDYLGKVRTGESTRLLHWHDGRLFMAQQDGSVALFDNAGTELTRLPVMGEGKEPLLKSPQAVAVHADTVYVVDNKSSQVVMYSQGGEFKGAFGKGQLSRPQGIAIHEGVVYVADTGNSRIQLYGINGVFLSPLEINNNPHNRAASEKQKIPYALDEPVDIEIDALGRIYVLDGDDALVKVYGQDGRYLGHLPAAGKPVDIGVSQGGIFVANLASYTINKYGFDFRLDSTFGSKGEGHAQFMSMSGLVVGSDAALYVGDAKAGVVHSFAATQGEPPSRVQRQQGYTSLEWLGETAGKLGNIAWDGAERLYAIDREQHAIAVIEKGVIIERIGARELGKPVAIALDEEGALLVVDRDPLRIVKLSVRGKLLSSFGTRGSGAGQFSDPVDIAVSSGGLIFVADRANKWVQVFNREGIFLNVIRNTLDPKILLQEPVAIDLDPEGRLYVLDRGRNSVVIYNARGEPQGEFAGSKESDAPGRLSNPLDLAVTDSEVMLLESGRVKVFTHGGDFRYAWGGEGAGRGEFTQPVAIAAANASVLAVVDSARLQRLNLLHKPTPPQGLVASGGMHTVDLRWSAAAPAYVDHYQVYRAPAKSDRYQAVAVTAEPQYQDTALEADSEYRYRVSAVSTQGYESTLEEAVSATTTRYIPHAVEGLRATPFAWQVRLEWQPLAASYSSSYRIYKKNGEEFAKIGESVEPRFVVSSLTPKSDYTFYVSAISSDGIESEKVAVGATTQVATTTPLQIDILELSDVFSNTYKVYEQEGIGRIRLTNNTGDTMHSIKLGFTLKNFMDYPSGMEIESLASGDSVEVPLRAVFNNLILNVTEDTPVQTEVSASYFENGEKRSFSKNQSINVYEKHRLSWDDRNRFASFVTPKDPLLLNYVRAVATQYGETKIKAQWAAMVFNSLGVLGLTYIQDPTNPYQVTSGKTDYVDYIQYPRETLERKSGDCDDLVALYAASLESLGVETRIVEVPGHMLMMFNTGIDADPDGYTMDEMYVIHEEKLWIPVETTVVGSSFLKAWELGSQNYYKWKDAGLTLLNIHEAWNRYKPASLPVAEWKPAAITREAIEKRYVDEYLTVLKIGIQTRTRRYQQAIAANGADVEAHLQIGIILATAGDHSESMKYFDQVLKLEPENAAALNNRANLHFLSDRLQEAEADYLAATRQDGSDPYLWVNLARTYKAQKRVEEAKTAFTRAVELDASMKREFRVLALELLNRL